MRIEMDSATRRVLDRRLEEESYNVKLRVSCADHRDSKPTARSIARMALPVQGVVICEVN